MTSVHPVGLKGFSGSSAVKMASLSGEAACSIEPIDGVTCLQLLIEAPRTLGCVQVLDTNEMVTISVPGCI